MELSDLSIRRATTQQEFLDVQKLHKTIWALQDVDVHPIHILIGIQQSNGLVLCAYYNNQPIGMLLSYCGITENHELYLHCHNVAVLKEYRSFGIGFKLLMELKEFMVAQKIQLSRATFDPLESRNANLYFRKAGCICNKYSRDYYGPMLNHLNINVPSDRLVIEYHLNNELADDFSGDTQYEVNSEILKKSSMHILNRTKIDNAGFPIPEEMNFDLDFLVQKRIKRFYIEIPSNCQLIRQKNMDIILKWRFALRKIFEKCFVLGLFITGFVYLEGHYYYILSFSVR